MKIETRTHEQVTIIGLSGMLRGGQESHSLSQEVKSLIECGNSPKVLIELAGTSLIDSSGIGELIASYTSVKKCGGRLKVSGAKDQVADILRLMKLQNIMEVFDTEADALASFAD